MDLERNITLSVKISTAERIALRTAAAQQDCDVQTLIRAVARELADGKLHVTVTDADRGRRTGPKKAESA